MQLWLLVHLTIKKLWRTTKGQTEHKEKCWILNGAFMTPKPEVLSIIIYLLLEIPLPFYMTSSLFSYLSGSFLSVFFVCGKKKLFPWSCFAQDSESQKSSLNWAHWSPVPSHSPALPCWRMGELCLLSGRQKKMPFSLCPRVLSSQARENRNRSWILGCLELIDITTISSSFPSSHWLLLVFQNSTFILLLPGSLPDFQIWVGCASQCSELPRSWWFLWYFAVVGLYFFYWTTSSGKVKLCLLLILHP